MRIRAFADLRACAIPRANMVDFFFSHDNTNFSRDTFSRLPGHATMLVRPVSYHATSPPRHHHVSAFFTTATCLLLSTESATPFFVTHARM